MITVRWTVEYVEYPARSEQINLLVFRTPASSFYKLSGL